MEPKKKVRPALKLAMFDAQEYDAKENNGKVLPRDEGTSCRVFHLR